MTDGVHLKRNVLLAILGVIAVAVGICLFLRKDDTLKVPLGVEQAAIVTYSGPELAAAPYKWGVAVNVRIAKVTERDGIRIYDVRYFVNREGTYDLRDYLAAEDGTSVSGLPAFKFQGDAKLAKNLDTRIRETEEMRIDVGGHYYEILATLFLLWIVWLLLLIFYRRPQMILDQECGVAAPTLAEILRRIQEQLVAGTLTVAGKAKMEMLLLQCWREELCLGPVPMRAAMSAIGGHERTGARLRKLQHWLHHPDSTVPREEIAAILDSIAVEEETQDGIATP